MPLHERTVGKREIKEVHHAEVDRAPATLSKKSRATDCVCEPNSDISMLDEGECAAGTGRTLIQHRPEGDLLARSGEGHLPKPESDFSMLDTVPPVTQLSDIFMGDESERVAVGDRAPIQYRTESELSVVPALGPQVSVGDRQRSVARSQPSSHNGDAGMGPLSHPGDRGG